MTSHLDDGRLVMLRDGDPSSASDASHVHACTVCAAELEDARERAAAVDELLSTLDAPVDVAAAKAAVRDRLDRGRARLAIPRRSIPIGRAAAILLVTAGAAAALPWSPISPWRAAPSTPAAVPAATPQPSADDAASAASVTVDVADRIEIAVRGASDGAALEIVWSDGAAARVAAPRGSSFALGAGRVEVDAADGPIRVEAPRAAEVAVTVNGRIYLERSSAGLTLSEPAAEVSDRGVRFLVREP